MTRTGMKNGGRKTIVTGAIGSLALVLSAAGAAHLAAAPTPRDVPVITTIADSLGGYQPRIESDLKGPYVNTSQVQSVVQGIGDWTLTTYYGRNATASSRSVFFDLTEPVDTTNPPPPMTAGYVQAHLIAKCHLVNVGFLQIPAGTTVQCPGAFRFQAPNGLWYRLSFQPDNFPHVERMNVTCTSADSAGCKTWTIKPSGTTLTGTDPNPKNRNKLVQIDSRNDTVIADLGDYYISFSISVSR